MRGKHFIGLAVLLAMLFSASLSSAIYLLNTADGRLTGLKEGTFQPDISMYYSQLPEVKMVDRTFRPRDSQFTANEEFEISQTGLSNMVRAAIPLAHNSAFIWITNQQLYWQARNNLGFGFAASHAGINFVNGPYWTLKALELSNMNKLYRDRGERFISNKDTLLQYYLPLYWKIIGIPRFPDDGNPSYLEFESGDPHFIGPTPIADTFDDPQSNKVGKWGVPGYFFQNRQWQWDRDGMVKYLDMGGIGIMLKRASMWIDYMWKATHSGTSPTTQGKTITLMGNDAEEGFRGMALATTRINQILALKAQLVADEEGNLGGINPKTYRPEDGLRYFPARIWPNMLLAGDMPERQWNFDIDDPRSLLFDQGALVWGSSHLFQSTYRMSDMFTENPPVDGGLMEKGLGVVPHYVANMVVRNLKAMHTHSNGLLATEWKPAKTKWWLFKSYANPGLGETVDMKGLAVTLIGLKEYVDRMQDPLALIDTPNIDNMEPELTEVALGIITRNADFLLRMQGSDGSFCTEYNVLTETPTGDCDDSAGNFWAIVSLLEAHKATEESKYVEAARFNWNYIWKNFWVEEHGLFRSKLGSDTIRIHANDIAAQLRVFREIMFATPIHLVKPIIAVFPRWMVQTMMLTGMILSEENRSGELALGIGPADWDNDGVPWLGKGHGKWGTAPTMASLSYVNIGAPGSNQEFNAIDGEKHWAERWGGDIRYNYQPTSQADRLKGLLLPVKIDYEAVVEEEEWAERDMILRWDGTIHKLPPAKPFKRGSDLSGLQIFQMNCAHCHGYTGEGITGIPFDSDSLARTRDDMFEVPHNGRFTRLMPEWGLGNQDEMESVLTDEEIYRIVDEIQSDRFKAQFIATENGIHHPNIPPKDPFYFISRSYIRGKQHGATVEDIALVINAQREAIETGQKIHVIQRLLDADKQGGAQGEIAKVTGWNPDLFRSVLDYSLNDQVRYAEAPIVFKDVALASVDELELEESGLEEALEPEAALDVEVEPKG